MSPQGRGHSLSHRGQSSSYRGQSPSYRGQSGPVNQQQQGSEVPGDIANQIQSIIRGELRKMMEVRRLS